MSQIEFEPDDSGEAIGFAANVAVIESVTGATARNTKRLELRSHGKDCGCHQCNTALTFDIADNADRADWMMNRGKWNTRVTVTQPKSKKRRR